MKWIAAVFAALALLIVLGGAGLLVADTVERYAANRPFHGTSEMVEWVVVFGIACALPVAGAYSLYSYRGSQTARIGSLLTAALLLVCLVILAMASVDPLRNMIEFDERSMTLNWSKWPIAAGTIAGLCVAALGTLAAGIVLLIVTFSGSDR